MKTRLSHTVRAWLLAFAVTAAMAGGIDHLADPLRGATDGVWAAVATARA